MQMLTHIYKPLRMNASHPYVPLLFITLIQTKKTVSTIILYNEWYNCEQRSIEKVRGF
jgi:hypothetical protein